MSKIDQIQDKGTIWCFCAHPANAAKASLLQSPSASFDKRLFDLNWIRDQGLIMGSPTGGRGNAHFIKMKTSDTVLVLREYLRGGLIRHFNPRYYLWRGMQRTRGYQELNILNTCIEKGLPVSMGYACKIKRHGLFYTASLITHKLEGKTLAEQLRSGITSIEVWQAVGAVIAKFHREGIWHADLNAHNIIVSGRGDASLIDFDRAREYPASELPAQSNIDRLHRSLVKEAKKDGYKFDEDGWGALLQAYKNG